MQPFPHPNDATRKIWSRLANWLQRYSSSKVRNFRHSRASNSKISGPKSNSTKLLCLSWSPATLMMIQSKMNKLAWRHHFPIISLWNFLDAEGQLTLQSVVRSGRNWKSSEILCMSSLPASTKRIGSKATEKRWRHHFPHYKSMGAFCCHGHQNFDPVCLKTLCSLSPPPVMLHIKFDQDWPTGHRDIQVRKCKIFVIQGQVTPKWVVWSGPKSNSYELLCLSWLPATLMMIRPKMNEWASMETAFSHYKSMTNFLDAQGQLTP